MNGTSSSLPWLTILAALPLLGSVAVLMLPRGTALAKQVAFGLSLLVLAVSIGIGISYNVGSTRFQFVENHMWIASFGAHYALGLDGLGLALVLLTTILTPVVILASWNDGDGMRWSSNTFFSWILALEGLAIGVFSATDVFLFYVLFEATLIPIYFLIGGFGGARRSYAAVKFLLFSLFGGLLMLASVVGLYVVSSNSASGPSYLLQDLMNANMSQSTGRWLFLGFFIAFAVKAPMWPVHTWLPEAASEATPGTSVLLVSVLDKIGTFGMMRFCLNIFPEASRWASPVIITLAVISVLYGALLAVGQNDIRRLIAYTSVSHFGFIVLGIFAFTSQAQAGASLYMFNHGLSTAALFLVTGFLITRRGSKMITDYGGVERVAPVLAGIFLVRGPVEPVAAGAVAVRERVPRARGHLHDLDRGRGLRHARHRVGGALHPADVPAHDDRAGARVDQEPRRPAATGDRRPGTAPRAHPRPRVLPQARARRPHTDRRLGPAARRRE